jgi:hypothetical protein
MAAVGAICSAGMGGQKGADYVWFRGIAHCRGGEFALDHFDLLTGAVDWVEKGIAPDSVTATGTHSPGRSHPLCDFPKHAHYTGLGDPQGGYIYFFFAASAARLS